MPRSGKPKIKSIVLIGQRLIDAYGRGPHRVVKWVDTSPGAPPPMWRPVINGLRTRHSTDKASVTIHGPAGVVWAEAPMQPNGVPALPESRAPSKRIRDKRRTPGAVIRVPVHGAVLSVTEYFVAQGGLGVTQFYVANDTRYPAHTNAKDRFVRWMTRTECRKYGVPYVNRSPKRKAPAKPSVYTPKVGDTVIVVGSAGFNKVWLGAVGTVDREADPFGLVMFYAPNHPKFRADSPKSDRRCLLNNPDPDVRLATAEERHAAGMAASTARHSARGVGAKIKVSEIAVGDRLLHLGDPMQRRVVTSVKPLTGFYLNYAKSLGLEERDGAYTYDGRATAEERAKAGLPPEVLVESTPLAHESRLARRARLAKPETAPMVLEDPIVQAALDGPSGPTKAERVIAALAIGSTAKSARVFSAEDVFRMVNAPVEPAWRGSIGFLSRQEVAEALTDLIKRRVVRNSLDGPATAGRTGPFFSLDLGAR